MNNKTKIIKWIVISLIWFVLAISVEFIFNFNAIKSTIQNRQLITVKKIKSNTQNNKQIFIIDCKNQFVNKLIVYYHAELDSNVKIEYNSKYVKDDILEKEYNKQITNYNKKVGKIKYVTDKNNKLSIDSVSIDNRIHVNIFRIIFVSICYLITVLLLYFYLSGFKNEKMHWYFVIFGFLSGLLLIVIQPTTTFFSYDDQIHFENVISLGQGEINISDSEFVMLDSIRFNVGSINTKEEHINQINYLNNNNKSTIKINHGRFIPYTKVAYILPSIGYNVCKIVGLPFSVCFVIGKIIILLSYLLIFGYAIKITKIGKKFLTLIGLLPTNLFLACQYSYDPAVMSGITLSIVILLNWFNEKEFKINFKNMLIFISAILYGGLSKAIYIPFILMFLFLPHSKFRSKKSAIYIKTLILILFMLLLVTFITPDTMSLNSGGDLRGGATNTFGQMLYIKNHVFQYIGLLLTNFINNLSKMLISIDCVGNYAYLSSIGHNTYFIILFLFLYVYFTEKDENQIQRPVKTLLLIISIGIMLLIWTALYLSFTPVGSNYIDGVQPRYFLPLIFPLFISFRGNKRVQILTDQKLNCIIYVLIILCFIYSIFNLVFLKYCI